MGENHYAKEPVTAEELAHYGNHVVQYSPEYSLCTGCETCMILSCQQCDDHPCYDACPKKGEAMKIDERGIVYIDETFCIGCGLCAKHCKFQPTRIAMKRDRVRKQWKAVKCDLCRNNPEGPQCIKWCPVRCIGISADSVSTADGSKPAAAE